MNIPLQNIKVKNCKSVDKNCDSCDYFYNPIVGEPVFLFNEVDFFSKQIIGKVNSYQYFNQLNLNKQDAINLAKKFGGYVGEYDNKGGYYIYFSNNDLAMQFARSDEFERVWSESQGLAK